MVSMQLDEVSRLITQRLKDIVETADPDPIRRRRKAISALFPYAVLLERRGQREMLDAFSRAARASKSRSFMWCRIKPFIMTLFTTPNPPFLNWVLGLISPGVLWYDQPHDHLAVAWRAVGPSYTEEADRSLVDELLHIAFVASLRPNVPRELSERPMEAPGDVIRRVRALGDIGILKSYLVLVLSEWDSLADRCGNFAEIETSIQEDFSGIGMGCHREDLIKRLDDILERLDHPPGCDEIWDISADPTGGRNPDEIQTTKERYGELKQLLLEVGGEAVKILARTSLRLILFGLLTPADTCRISLNLRVRSAPPISMISHRGSWHRSCG